MNQEDDLPQNNITISPNIRFGKPCIAGTRMAVQDIVIMHLINESSIDWIVENFPLTPAQIHAALSYYNDHKDEIDESIRKAEEEFQRKAARSENTLEKLRARPNRTD